MFERFAANGDYVDTPSLRRRFPGILWRDLASRAHPVSWQRLVGA
jgi:hypothetical protein